jgi:hypothetical protein
MLGVMSGVGVMSGEINMHVCGSYSTHTNIVLEERSEPTQLKLCVALIP